MRSIAFLALAALGLAACEAEIKPPTTRGVCWRMTFEGAEPRYAPIADYNDSLYSCAGQLEAVRMRTNPTGQVMGAFNGHFIFVTAAAVQTADRYKGNRSHVFTPVQRAELQKQIKAAMAADSEFGTVRAPTQPGQ
jgi:hypothetical protein